MDIGERIKYVRQLRGITQSELAEKVGFTGYEKGRIRISQYENGSRIPRKDTLKKISEALNVDSYYLCLEDHTASLDFAFELLDWDRTSNFTIKKEIVQGEDHFLIDFNMEIFNDFLEEWMNKKADLESGKISKNDYIEWSINYPNVK